MADNMFKATNQPDTLLAKAERSRKPQAGQDYHGQSHPGEHLSLFNLNLVGLTHESD